VSFVAIVTILVNLSTSLDLAMPLMLLLSKGGSFFSSPLWTTTGNT